MEDRSINMHKSSVDDFFKFLVVVLGNGLYRIEKFALLHPFVSVCKVGFSRSYFSHQPVDVAAKVDEQLLIAERFQGFGLKSSTTRNQEV